MALTFQPGARNWNTGESRHDIEVFDPQAWHLAGKWAINSEAIAAGERNDCFCKIQPAGQKNIETKHISLVQARL